MNNACNQSTIKNEETDKQKENQREHKLKGRKRPKTVNHTKEKEKERKTKTKPEFQKKQGGNKWKGKDQRRKIQEKKRDQDEAIIPKKIIE